MLAWILGTVAVVIVAVVGYIGYAVYVAFTIALEENEHE